MAQRASDPRNPGYQLRRGSIWLGSLTAVVVLCGTMLLSFVFNSTTTPCAPAVKNALRASQGKIVFVSNRDGNNELYRMNADGSNLANLTHDPADDRSPILAPDGKSVIFESNRTGRYQMYTLNIYSGTLTTAPDRTENNVQKTEFVVSEQDYSWSPDHTRRAYTRNGQIVIDDGSTAILKVDTETFASGDLDLPRWSANGRFLLVSYFPHTGGALREQGYERWGLYAIDAATLHPCRLTPLSRYDNRDPLWVAVP